MFALHFHFFQHLIDNSLHLLKYIARKSLYDSEVLSIFFYLGFLSQTFTNHRIAGQGGGHSFNSSLLLPPASQTLTHQPSDYCRQLTSAHSQQPDSNREPLAYECKSLTTKLRALKPHTYLFFLFCAFFLYIKLIKFI